MSSYKTTGIVIRRTDLKEFDRIFSFLTVDRGIVDAVAKSVRKPGARLASHLELFNQVELMLAPANNLDIVTSARAQTTFQTLTKNYERLKIAFLACEMITKLARQTASTNTYYLLLDTLKSLSGTAALPVLELYFKLKLLDQLGYKPNLEQTVKSKEEILSYKSYAFAHAEGGLVESPQARAQDPAIGPEHVKLWRLLLRYPLTEVIKIKGAAQPAQESLGIINDFYDYLFGKRFRSSEI